LAPIRAPWQLEYFVTVADEGLAHRRDAIAGPAKETGTAGTEFAGRRHACSAEPAALPVASV